MTEKEYRVKRTIEIVHTVTAESKERAAEKAEYLGINWREAKTSWDIKEKEVV